MNSTTGNQNYQQLKQQADFWQQQALGLKRFVDRTNLKKAEAKSNEGAELARFEQLLDNI